MALILLAYNAQLFKKEEYPDCTVATGFPCRRCTKPLDRAKTTIKRSKLPSESFQVPGDIHNISTVGVRGCTGLIKNNSGEL